MLSTTTAKRLVKVADPKQWKIVIVDDHPIVRRGISDTLSDQPGIEIVCQASDSQTAIEAVREHQPDLTVIDISLGNESGLDLIRSLRDISAQLKILVLSIHDEKLYAERALRIGANGYLSKNEPAHILVEAVRTVLSGGTSLSPDMTNRLVQQVVHKDQSEATGIESLSDRELQVFRLLGTGMGTRQIAKELHVSIKTIESHRENIKHKLDVSSANELVRHAVAWVEHPS